MSLWASALVAPEALAAALVLAAPGLETWRLSEAARRFVRAWMPQPHLAVPSQKKKKKIPTAKNNRTIYFFKEKAFALVFECWNLSLLGLVSCRVLGQLLAGAIGRE